jgi:hypothetical protein
MLIPGFPVEGLPDDFPRAVDPESAPEALWRIVSRNDVIEIHHIVRVPKKRPANHRLIARSADDLTADLDVKGESRGIGFRCSDVLHT